MERPERGEGEDGKAFGVGTRGSELLKVAKQGEEKDEAPDSKSRRTLIVTMQGC